MRVTARAGAFLQIAVGCFLSGLVTGVLIFGVAAGQSNSAGVPGTAELVAGHV